ncbi:DUF2079 domain-containing protein [Kineococcus sp. SYSU DK004]|uniref:DUF2079 domain-containing protein n=1 Tax=Kineococcus sp. SYSU DK004 TaxID=3383125 RepID=UPI003D7E56D6
MPVAARPAPPSTAPPRTHRLDVALAALLGTAVVTWLGLAQWNLGRAGAYDLGIFVQAAQSWVAGELPRSEIRTPGGWLLFGEHFSPVTVLFGAAWALWQDPRSLLVAQGISLGVAAGLLQRTASRHVGRGGAWAVTVLFVLSYGVVAMATFDVHEVAFAVPLLVGALSAVLERRVRAAVAWSLPLLLVKEDLGLSVGAMAVLLFLRARTGAERRWAVALALAAVAGLVGAAFVIQAANPSGQNPFAPAFASLFGGGSSGGSSDGSAPVGPKVALVLTALAAGGFCWVASPLALVALPTVGWRLVTSVENHTSTGFHYDAVLMPVVALAVVDVASRTRHRRAVLALALVCGLAASAVNTARHGDDPNPFDADAWRPGPVARDLVAVRDELPRGAVVAADADSGAYLTGRGDLVVREAAARFANPAEWMVLNLARGNRAAKESTVAAASAAPDVRVVRRGDVVALGFACEGLVRIDGGPDDLPDPVWVTGC